MAARTKSKVTPKYKTKYRVTNWREYEAGLRRRGDITVWFDDAAVRAWNAPPSGKPGGQPTYSDLAIITALTLRTVFHLPLRQAEGFVGSLMRLMRLDLEVPDHTTLSRRGRTVDVPKLARVHDGPLHLMIDSTGLKVTGDGEWHAAKHGGSKKRRSWRKLHIGVDGHGYIVASELTSSNADDALTVPTLVAQLTASIARFTADGAYDTEAVYDAVAGSGTPDIRLVVPPRRTATRTPSAEGAWAQRDAAVARIEQVGRRAWRKEAGANRQARVENAMFRLKRITGDGLRARNFEGQKREAVIRVNVLNRMLALGMPQSVVVG